MKINVPLITSVPLEQPIMEEPLIQNVPLQTTYTGEISPVFSQHKLKDYEKYFSNFH